MGNDFSARSRDRPMKALSLFISFNRSSISAAAVVFALALVCVSNASATENQFDALSGVTAEVLSPAAMDAIQGTGSVHIGFHPDDKWNHWDWVDLKPNAGPFNVWVRLERTRGEQLTIWRD